MKNEKTNKFHKRYTALFLPFGFPAISKKQMVCANCGYASSYGY